MRIKSMNSIFVIFTGVILLSGIFVSGLYSFDAFAEKGGNNKQQANGCQNSNSDKMKDKNKHCIDANSSKLIPDTNTCSGPDLRISATELGETLEFIQAIEASVFSAGLDTNPNSMIDTLDEWDELQVVEPGICT